MQTHLHLSMLMLMAVVVVIIWYLSRHHRCDLPTSVSFASEIKREKMTNYWSMPLFHESVALWLIGSEHDFCRRELVFYESSKEIVLQKSSGINCSLAHVLLDSTVEQAVRLTLEEKSMLHLVWINTRCSIAVHLRILSIGLIRFDSFSHVARFLPLSLPFSTSVVSILHGYSPRALAPVS